MSATQTDPLFDRYRAASIAHLELLLHHQQLGECLVANESQYAAVDASAIKVQGAAAELVQARDAYLADPT